MKNIENIESLTEIEILLTYLNLLAESFERGDLINKHFVLQSTGAIGFARFQETIDRIEEKLLCEQITDISRDEYSRFCDPVLPEFEIEHKHNEGE